MDRLLRVGSDPHKVRRHLVKEGRSKFNVLMKEVLKETEEGNQEAVNALKSIFEAITSTSDSQSQGSNKSILRELLVIAYGLTLSLVEGQQQEERPPFLNLLFGTLIISAEHLPGEELFVILKDFNAKIGAGRSLNEQVVELYPRLIEVIETFHEITHEEFTRTGKECKLDIVQELIYDLDWAKNPVLIASIVAKLKELKRKDYEEAVNKVKQLYPSFEQKITELPSLAYQMVTIAKKSDLKKEVLSGFLDLFRRLDAKYASSDEGLGDLERNIYWQNAAMVVFHISFASSSDKEIVKEMVKIIKSKLPHEILNPFSVALALAVSGQHNREEEVISTLKTTIKRYYTQLDMSQVGSQWMRAEMDSEKTDIFATIIPLVKMSVCGKFLDQELIRFAFQLIDTLPNFTKTTRLLSKPLESMSPNEASCCLGAKLLLETFQFHESVRKPVITQLFNRICSKVGGCVVTYIEILSVIVQKQPQLLLNCKDIVKELICWIPSCPFQAALLLLNALLPLLKISMVLKDKLMETLRKSLFHRNPEVKKVAVSGFILAIKCFKVSGSLPWSQTQASQPSSIIGASQLVISQRFNGEANEALCVELIRLLERCINQQEEIRQLVYEGVYLILFRNPKLVGLVCKLLFKQLSKYYEQDKEKAPLKLDKCVNRKAFEDEATLDEPIASLLMSIHLCLQLSDRINAARSSSQKERDDDDQEDTGLFPESIILAKESMEGLLVRFKDVEPKDFGIESASNLKGVEGQVRMKTAEALLGVFEVLIEYLYMSRDKDRDNCHELLSFYSKWKKLCEHVMNATAPASNRPKRLAAKKKKKTEGIQNVTEEEVEEQEQDDENSRSSEGTIIASSLGSRAHSPEAEAEVKGVANKSKRSKYHSMYSLQFLASFLKDVMIDSSASEETEEAQNQGLPSLRDHLHLVQSLTKTLNAKLQTWATSGQFDGFTSDNWDYVFPFVCTAARSLYRKLQETKDRSEATGEANSPEFIYVLVETLKTAITMVSIRSPSSVSKLAHYIWTKKEISFEELKQVPPDILQDSVLATVHQLKDFAGEALKDTGLTKCVPFFLTALDVLISEYCVSGTSEEGVAQVYDVMVELAKGTHSEDLEVVRTMLNLCIKLSRRQDTKYMRLLLELSGEIHKVLGSISQSFTDGYRKKFKIVTSKSVAVVCNLVLKHIEANIKEIEKVFEKLKISIADSTEETFREEKRTQYETRICWRMTQMVNIVREFSNSKLTPGPIAKETMDILKKVYDFLSLLSQYYMKLLGDKMRAKMAVLSNDYVDLVKKCGELLSSSSPDFLVNSDNSPAVGQKRKRKNLDEQGKGKVVKKSKQTTSLVFAMENYERCLIELQKKTGVPLIKHSKLGSARDFCVINNLLVKESDLPSNLLNWTQPENEDVNETRGDEV